MNVNKITLNAKAYPEQLRHLSSPPQQLYVAGPLEKLLQKPKVAIVGSRKISSYGRQVTEKLARELASNNVVIISGLAYGVDAASHHAVLEAGGDAIAVLPTSLDKIYPASNRGLAQNIINAGGALLSEYGPADTVHITNFVARNRIIAGLADAIVVIEASLKSGSLHTARFALEQGKDVLAVPGNITSPASEGTNNLIKAGATPVTSVDDILQVLDITPKIIKTSTRTGDPAERAILEALASGTTDSAELLAATGLSIDKFNQALTMLELKALVRPLGNNHWSLA